MLFAQWNGGMPEAASTMAAQVDDLYVFLIWVSVVSLIVVGGAILFFGVKYRRTEANPEATSLVDHNLQLEVVWTLIPTVILFVLFFWGVNTWMGMRVAPSESMDIHVTARQWSWQFRVPGRGILSDKPGRTCGQTSSADYDLHGRDSLVVRAGVPDEARRSSGALHDGMVRSTQCRKVQYHVHGVLRQGSLADESDGRGNVGRGLHEVD